MKIALAQMQMLSDLIQKCIGENARTAQDQADYQNRYDELVSRYDGVKARYDEISRKISEQHAKYGRLEAFAKAIRSQGNEVVEFDEGLWGTLVDYVTVYSKEKVSVTFMDGTEIHVG